jgi:hypothetical protein
VVSHGSLCTEAINSLKICGYTSIFVLSPDVKILYKFTQKPSACGGGSPPDPYLFRVMVYVSLCTESVNSLKIWGRHHCFALSPDVKILYIFKKKLPASGGLRPPDPLPRFCPWTPLRDFCPQTQIRLCLRLQNTSAPPRGRGRRGERRMWGNILRPPSQKSWIRPCMQ